MAAAEVGVGLQAGLVRIDLRHDAGSNLVVLDREAGALGARSAEDLDVPVLPDELGVAGVDQVQDVARLHDSDELRLCCDSHRADLG